MAESNKNPKSASNEVGYGKPPKTSQFKPGQSGNPKGRPKGARNLDTLMAEELESLIQIREQGAPVVVSKGHAVIKALIAKAMQGDVRAAAVFIEWNDRQKALRPNAEDELDEPDIALLERALKRARKS